VKKCLTLLSSVYVIYAVTAVDLSAQQNPPLNLPENVAVETDIVYKTASGQKLKLDLFLPKDDRPNHPAIVFIHGGGFRGGNKEQFQRQAAHMASQGFVGACIQYRLSGVAKFPAAVTDCKCAVRWLRAHVAKYKIDTNRIAAVGGSAGGNLAAMLGTVDESAGYDHDGCHPGISSRVQAVVPFNGAFDMTEKQKQTEAARKAFSEYIGFSYADRPDLFRAASPNLHIDPDDPPFLFLHGSADDTIPFHQSVDFKKRLEAVGIRVELYEADGAAHGFFNRPPWYLPTLKRMEKFLKNVFERD
jgi:acetyl esterase/lipase